MKKSSKKFNYRHYIALALTLVAILLYFRFPYCLGRLIESIRDFAVSIAYYFCELFGDGASFSVTVHEYPKIPFFGGSSAPSPDNVPSFPMPQSFVDFKEKWILYWKTFADKYTLLAYLYVLLGGVYWISYFLSLILPVVLLLALCIRLSSRQVVTDHGIESKPLRFYKKVVERCYIAVKAWFLDFFAFLGSHKVYLILWGCLFAFYFNLFTIVIEFFAYYFYFTVSFDFKNLYRQLYKLFFDLWAFIDFMPVWALILFGIWLLDKIANNIGYGELEHGENRNRGFINERGVLTIVYGAMGTGKTALISDMTLSEEKQQRDDALEIILECDMKFPNFPWILLEDELKRAFESHVVFSVPSCIKFMREKSSIWYTSPTKENLFGYDFQRYGLYFNDGLKLSYLWDVLKDYACAYLIYTVKTSLISANYSIRSDILSSDLGNFPLYNADFFKRDPRLLDSFSRHSHILDFDMLRLGKIMLQNNPNATAFGFGVYVISEIDKERKNTPELSDVKRDSEECNQKNDLFNSLLKMSRHACVVANRVFVKIFADLQRPESLGADARELGEVLFIKDVGDSHLTLPFFSPFYFFEAFFLFFKSRFCKSYLQRRYTRGDYTLFSYLIKNIFAKMQAHYTRVSNTFGREILSLNVEDGRMDGSIVSKKYFRQFKKIWSERYATDCHSAIFSSRAVYNTVGLDDIQTYATIVATGEELDLQHSLFQKEIHKIDKRKP